MTALLDIPVVGALDVAGAFDELPVVGDASLRRTLRDQIARLEADLPVGAGNGSGNGARVLSVAELERVRDGLLVRIQERRFADGEQQERARRKREEIGLGLRRGSVTNEEVGEPGCTRWQSWFRLTISGGCP